MVVVVVPFDDGSGGGSRWWYSTLAVLSHALLLLLPLLSVADRLWLRPCATISNLSYHAHGRHRECGGLWHAVWEAFTPLPPLNGRGVDTMKHANTTFYHRQRQSLHRARLRTTCPVCPIVLPMATLEPSKHSSTVREIASPSHSASRPMFFYSSKTHAAKRVDNGQLSTRGGS